MTSASTVADYYCGPVAVVFAIFAQFKRRERCLFYQTVLISVWTAILFFRFSFPSGLLECARAMQKTRRVLLSRKIYSYCKVDKQLFQSSTLRLRLHEQQFFRQIKYFSLSTWFISIFLFPFNLNFHHERLWNTSE